MSTAVGTSRSGEVVEVMRKRLDFKLSSLLAVWHMVSRDQKSFAKGDQ